MVRAAAVDPRLLLGRGAPQALARLSQGLLGGTPLPGTIYLAWLRRDVETNERFIFKAYVHTCAAGLEAKPSD